jgi:hypothetical protein
LPNWGEKLIEELVERVFSARFLAFSVSPASFEFESAGIISEETLTADESDDDDEGDIIGDDVALVWLFWKPSMSAIENLLPLFELSDEEEEEDEDEQDDNEPLDEEAWVMLLTLAKLPNWLVNVLSASIVAAAAFTLDIVFES